MTRQIQRAPRYKYRVEIAEKERIKRGWSFSALARETRLSTRTIIDFLQTGRAREATMRKVAVALGIPIEELLPAELARAS